MHEQAASVKNKPKKLLDCAREILKALQHPDGRGLSWLDEDLYSKPGL